LRLGIFTGKRAFGCLKVIENAAARLEIALARLGERQPARRAGEQPHTKFLLERRQMAADCGERQVQAASGARQAPGVGDTHKHAHGGEAVHFDYSGIWKYQLE
jgi:hypothetical protein